MTPLYKAAHYGEAEVIPLLLAAGALVDARDMVRESDQTDNHTHITIQYAIRGECMYCIVCSVFVPFRKHVLT